MLHYFNFALVFAALFNVALFYHFPISRCNVLIFHYYFSTVLFNGALDECCTFPFCTNNVASCINYYFKLCKWLVFVFLILHYCIA